MVAASDGLKERARGHRPSVDEESVTSSGLCLCVSPGGDIQPGPFLTSWSVAHRPCEEVSGINSEEVEPNKSYSRDSLRLIRQEGSPTPSCHQPR